MGSLISKLQEKIYINSPCFVQNILCSITGLKIKKQRYGSCYQDYYDLLKKQEFYSEEKLKAYQEMELKRLLKHCCENVPYYKNLFAKLNIEPEDITLNTLDKLPILSKDTIKENTEDFVAQNYSKESLIARITSGTTGSGMKFFTDSKALQMEYATAWARSRPKSQKSDRYISFGGRVLLPINSDRPPFYRKNYADKQILFSQYHLKDKNLIHYYNAFNSLNYDYIQGYPSSLFALAKHIEENKLVLKKFPKVIYTSSETLLKYQRELIEKVFKCEIFDYYGTTELTTTFYQCQHKRYHINFEYGVTEFLPLNIADCEDLYEIVSTGFLNNCFPLIRYKLNDFVALEPEKFRCDCNRAGRVVKSIKGRLEDFVVTPEGRKLGLLAPIFKLLVNIKESQIVQKKPDQLIIKVVKGAAYTDADEKMLIKEFYARVPSCMKIKIDYVKAIERTKSGKLRAIVSKIKID